MDITARMGIMMAIAAPIPVKLSRTGIGKPPMARLVYIGTVYGALCRKMRAVRLFKRPLIMSGIVTRPIIQTVIIMTTFINGMGAMIVTGGMISCTVALTATGKFLCYNGGHERNGE